MYTEACLNVICNNARKEISGKYTYVNGVRLETRKFNIAMIAVRETLTIKMQDHPTRKYFTSKILESRNRFKEVQKELGELTANNPIGSDFPSCQMRYIIYQETVKDEDGDYDVCRFYFASRHTSHSELAEELKKAKPDAWVRGGGFYSRRSANGLRELYGGFRPSPYNMEIILWGISDSYGLNPNVLDKAIADYLHNGKDVAEDVKFTVL